MNDWGDDQYFASSDARYPLFSDMQTTDYNIGSMIPAEAKKVASPEGKLRSAQAGVPAYVQKCQCSCQAYQCPREYSQSYPGLMRESMRGGAPLGYVTIDTNMLVMIFLFIIIVFICCYCTKSMGELKAQIKALKMLVKGATTA